MSLPFLPKHWEKCHEIRFEAHYNDRDDDTVRKNARKLKAFSFVPLDDVENLFNGKVENAGYVNLSIYLYVSGTLT